MMRRCILLAGVALAVPGAFVFAFTSQPHQIGERFSFKDPLPGSDDSFGWSVAMQGDIAVIGMPTSDRAGPNPAAFVYEVSTGRLLHTLVPFNGQWAEQFGSSVAIDGNLIAIGARLEDVPPLVGGGTLGGDAGAAHVFDLTTGRQISHLVTTIPEDNHLLGSSVAIDGTKVLLGGRAGAITTNSEFVGAAYLFDAVTGQQMARLVPSTPSSRFGFSLALEGETALIGANTDSTYGEFAGAVYVFDISTNTELRKIVPDDIAATDSFGSSIDIDGNHAIIGSTYHDGHSADSGAAYVFDVTTGEQLAKLLPPSVNPFPGAFGHDVVITGSTSVVTAPHDGRRGDYAGAAYLFNWRSETALLELVPSSSGVGDFFGWSADIANGTTIVGSIRNFGPMRRGVAYAFVIPEPSSMALCTFLVAAGGACIRTKVNTNRSRLGRAPSNLGPAFWGLADARPQARAG